jgi:AraC-like DNA-binding protein
MVANLQKSYTHFPDSPIPHLSQWFYEKLATPYWRRITVERVAVYVLDGGFVHRTQWTYQNLSAPHWRLYWNRTSGAAIIFKSKKIPLQPTQAYLIPPNTEFASCLTRPVDHFCLHFLASSPYEIVTPGIFQFPITPVLTEAFEQLPGSLKAGSVDNRLLSTRVMFLCYYALCQVPVENLTPSFTDPRVLKVIACMDSRHEQPAKNAELAREIGMHTIAFIRLFKQVTGYAPQEFSRLRRIERACQLLRFSEDSIDTIAANLGFCDRCHFTRVFKKARGISPSRFRHLP